MAIKLTQIDFINQFSKQVNRPVIDIWKWYLQTCNAIRLQYPSWSEFEIEKQAKHQLIATIRPDSIPHLFFEGMVFGIFPSFDMNRQRYKESLEQYQKNPRNAVLKGFTDQNGVPLDNHGNPLKQRWFCVVVGFARETRTNKMKPFFMKVFDKQADPTSPKYIGHNTPMWTPVMFEAKTRKGSLNCTHRTMLVPTNVNFPSVVDILKHPSMRDHYIGQLSDVPGWLNYHHRTFERFLLVECDIIDIDRKRTVSGSWRMVVGDLSSIDPMVCFVNPLIPPNFSCPTHVILCANPYKVPKEQDDRHLLNVMGIYEV
jgi:hypothetical protein